MPEHSVPAVFRLLAAATQESTSPPLPSPPSPAPPLPPPAPPAPAKTVSRHVFARYFDSSSGVGLGEALWSEWMRDASQPDREAQTMRLGCFVRGVTSVLDSNPEQRCLLLYRILSDGSSAEEAGAVGKEEISRLLRRAFTLETGAQPACNEPFESAANAGASRCSSTDEPRGLQFAQWAVSQLPGLVNLVYQHV